MISNIERQGRGRRRRDVGGQKMEKEEEEGAVSERGRNSSSLASGFY